MSFDDKSISAKRIPWEDPAVENHEIRSGYPVNQAEWIWLPEGRGSDPVIARLSCAFTSTESPLRIHVSADQRFELLLDGVRIGRGPDACDARHWAFHVYEISAFAGAHTFEAVVWWAGDQAPSARTTVAPGFILRAEGDLHDTVSTGHGPWTIKRLRGVTWMPEKYFLVGSGIAFDVRTFFDSTEAPVPAVVSERPNRPSKWGTLSNRRRFFPSNLPEQLSRVSFPGGVRAVIHGKRDPDAPIPEDTTTQTATEPFARFGSEPLAIPAGSETTLLWDLGDYYCAYPQMTFKGAGGTVRVSWAESLYSADTGVGKNGRAHLKRDRGALIGKTWRGLYDTFTAAAQSRTCTGLWWRSGRYLLITLTAADDKPLTVDRFAIEETGMPLESRAAFAADIPELDGILDLCWRGIRMCAHETYMDCPYYEQLMYLGDTRLQVLTTFAVSGESALARRVIDIGDWSRRVFGLTTSCYPSRGEQMIPAFSLFWCLMVRDYLYWIGDPAYVRTKLKGVRAILDEFDSYVSSSGFLSNLPGWVWMDWVPEWPVGVPPGGNGGTSALYNLLFLLTLQRCADLETELGNPQRGEEYRRRAQQLGGLIHERFWNERKKLYQDDDTPTFSQHAQALAILSGLSSGSDANDLIHRTMRSKRLVECSVYFKVYLHSAMSFANATELLVDDLDFWADMVRNGMKTPIEAPEPSRSDCHAWGSHPWFHLLATVAGIRPAVPGFERVSIKPKPGDLKELSGKMPHPVGDIHFAMRFSGKQATGSVTLPEGIHGAFEYENQKLELTPGNNALG